MPTHTLGPSVIYHLIYIRLALSLIRVSAFACTGKSFGTIKLRRGIIAWTKHYSGQKEIQEYLRSVAKKYHLYERIRFRTEITRAEWIEHRQQWQVEWRNLEGSQTIESSYFDIV